MDSKKVIETLLKIARNQQKIITKLAQQRTPEEEKEFEKKYDPMYDPSKETPAPVIPGPAPVPAPATKPGTKYDPALLAPPGKRLTESEWRALEKQRGMKPFEATDTTEPGWVPQVMAPKAPQTPTSPSGPAQQGGPPGQSKPLTETEKQYLEMLKKKNQ